METLETLIDDTDAIFADRGEEMADHAEALERAQRVDDARELGRQLPPWLRKQRGEALSLLVEDLRLRVSDVRLIDAADFWEWGANLLLMGPTGIGKTSATALLWHRLVVRGVQTGGKEWRRTRGLVWVRAVQLATARRKHPLGRGDAPEIVAACEASLLFLDDLDREPESKRPVAEVLAARYDAGLPTVLTTGLDGPELTETHGAAVVRRIRETGGRRALVVDCFAARPGVLRGSPPVDGKSAAAGGA